MVLAGMVIVAAGMFSGLLGRSRRPLLAAALMGLGHLLLLQACCQVEAGRPPPQAQTELPARLLFLSEFVGLFAAFTFSQRFVRTNDHEHRLV
jgi:hypothetical protein